MTSELTEKSSHMIDDESNGDVIVEKHDYLFKVSLFFYICLLSLVLSLSHKFS